LSVWRVVRRYGARLNNRGKARNPESIRLPIHHEKAPAEARAKWAPDMAARVIQKDRLYVSTRSCVLVSVHFP